MIRHEAIWRKEVFIPTLKKFAVNPRIYESEKPKEIFNYPKGKGRKISDVALFHDAPLIPSPIGIELKWNNKFNVITEGLLEQIKNDYLHTEFSVPKENDWHGAFPLFALATEAGLRTGHTYEKYFVKGGAGNFFIDRFAWRAGIAIIRKDVYSNVLLLSWKNALWELDGTIFKTFNHEY